MQKRLDEAKNFLLLRDFASAEKIFQELLKKSPTNVEVLHGLSLISFSKKRFEESKKFLLKALQKAPSDCDLYMSLAILYREMGDLEKELTSLEKAKNLFEKKRGGKGNPKYCHLLLKLADIYLCRQKIQDAKAVLKKVLEKQPKNIGALKALAQVYVALQKYYLAIETLEKLDIDQAVFESLKVEIFFLKEDRRNALKSAQKAVDLDPKTPRYWGLLGECYLKAYELEKSKDAFQKGLDLDPLDPKMLSYMLGLQIRMCNWKERGATIACLRSLAAQKTEGENYLKVIQPPIAIIAGFSNQELQKVAEARCKTIEEMKLPLRSLLSFSFKRGRRKKIRIGYLSSDFHEHATAHLMMETFALHSREHFEIYDYSYGKGDKSELRKNIQEGCDQFIEIQHQSDKAVAEKMNKTGIDILVDLKGHIVDNRLGILALRPAPVQLHYLGYPGTIGASFIDYIIADKYLIPKSERRYYSESIIFLPDTYQANTKTKNVQKKIPKKREYSIPEDVFVFCCFNQNDKFDTQTVEAWMKILHSVPQSVLWAWGNYENLKEKLVRFGEEKGIDAARFLVSKTEPYSKHLPRMQLADLFLDTLNYNAHTSCSDALRAGLPILTCPGKTFASRVAASLLKKVKANELIAKNKEDYIQKAIGFAKEPEKLKKIQEKINKNRPTSKIYDSALFTENLDKAYLKIWEIYQSGSSPRDVYI